MNPGARDTRQRPAKFKDSCDSCARSKVKCNRVRPSCQRCLRHGILCHYSLARRGKFRTLSEPNLALYAPDPAIATAPTAATAPAPPPTPASPLSPSQAHCTLSSSSKTTTTVTTPAAADIFFCDDDLQFPSHDFSSHPGFSATHFPGLDISCDDIALDMSAPATGATSPEKDQNTPPSDADLSANDILATTGTTNPTIIDWANLHIDPTASSKLFHASHYSPLLHSFLNPSASASLGRQPDDMFAAAAAPAAMAAGPSTCPGPGRSTYPGPGPSDCLRLALSILSSLHPPGGQGAAGLDAVLKANRAAVDAVLAVAGCGCGGPAGEALGTVLGLVCAQAVAGYAHVAEDAAREGPAVAIGEYVLDGSARRRMLGGVLLGELARVSEAVDSVLGAGAGEMSKAMGEVLRSRLAATVGAVRVELGEF